MKLVLKSRGSLAVLAFAALSYAAGTGFACLAWATIHETSSGHYFGLYRAADGLHALGFLALSGAVLLAGWRVIRSPESSGDYRAEVVGAALAGFIVTGGYSKIAATTPYDSSGHLTKAIGFGLWAALALFHGAHHNAASRRGDRDTASMALVWAAASLGLLLYAIAVDLVPVGVDARTNGVAGSILVAVGTALVAIAVISSRSRGWVSSRSSGVAVIGLIILMACSIGDAVVSGIELGPSATFTGLKVGYALVFAGSTLAVLIIGFAAWVKRHQVAGELATLIRP